ncbi:MAG TPA: IPT/TIG domain-containing protein, partial [Solirubrobacteraceae bacterium]|nr:IPT/TIG domain-containing protein [Solirubrobacteraceae bacterium]
MCAVLLGVPPVVWAGGSVRAAVAGVGNVSLASTVTPATLGLGSGFDDVATLTPPQGGARPTGTMSFTVYGPTDPTCAGPILFDSTNTVSSTPGLSGGFSTTSGSYTPPNVGTYRVISTYSGDANYQRTSTGCGDPAQTVTVGLGPTVTAISPGAGPAGGANTVTITGTNLAGATTVDFGGAATPATVLSATQVAATAPAGSGTVDVTVTTPFGTSPTGAVDRYTFAPAAGPP